MGEQHDHYPTQAESNARRNGIGNNTAAHAAVSIELGEWQVCFDSRFVSFVHARHFAQLPFSFRILGRKQMASGGLRAQNFASGSDLKTLGDSFFGFTSGDRLRHGARR